MTNSMYYILLLISAYNLLTAFRYMYEIEINARNQIHIMGDEIHSLQHIAIVGMTAVLSIAMVFGNQSGYEILTHIFYNATLMFIVYPHLTSEK